MADTKNQFGDALRKHLNNNGLTIRALARKSGYAAASISCLLSGKSHPKRSTIHSLAAALGLEPAERDALLKAEGFDPRASSPDEIRRRVETALEGLSSDEVEVLLNLFARNANELKQRERDSLIQTAIIPAAGWQHEHLREKGRFDRTLFPAIREALEASIGKLIVVTAKEPLFSLESAKRAFGERAEFKSVFQSVGGPKGLGQALRLVNDTYPVEQPVALILPDEIDRFFRATTDLVGAYELGGVKGHPLLAVNKEEATTASPFSSYGAAVLGKEMSRGIHRIRTLKEKPQSPEELPIGSHFIAGRYILTPSVFRELAKLKPNSKDRIELTDALESIKTRYAFTLSRNLVPLGIGALFNFIDNDHIFESATSRDAVG